MTGADPDVMERLAYWHDLRDELPAEAVEAARSYLIGHLAPHIDPETWQAAVDQALELAWAEVDTTDQADDALGGPSWPTAAAWVLTGLGCLGLAEQVAQFIAAVGPVIA